MPFTGFLYAGLMIDAHGAPKTVEFNCRLGDPETQPILMRLKSDLFELLLQATAPTDGTLDEVELQWDRRVALGVVMAAAGYPAAPREGDAITGLPARQQRRRRGQGVPRRHGAARRRRRHRGRPRAVRHRARRLDASWRSSAPTRRVRGIRFDGAQYRSDIGQRAIKR